MTKLVLVMALFWLNAATCCGGETFIVFYYGGNMVYFSFLIVLVHKTISAVAILGFFLAAGF